MEAIPGPWPPHRRRHLRSDTVDTFLRIMSLAARLEPLGNASNKVDQTNADGKTISDSEKLPSKDDASCSKVANMVESVDGDRLETNNTEPEILPPHGVASCSEVENSAESVNEDRKKTTNIEPETLITCTAPSSLNITSADECVQEGRMEKTDMEPEIISTNGGDASRPNATNVVEPVTEDRMEISDIGTELLSTTGDTSCSKFAIVDESVQGDGMETDEIDCGNRKSAEPGVGNYSETANFLTTVAEPQNSLVGSLLKDSETVRRQSSSMFDGNEEVRSLLMENNELPQVNMENSLPKCELMNSLLHMAGEEEVEEGEFPMDFLIDDDYPLDSLFEEAEARSSDLIDNEAQISNPNEKRTNEVENKHDKDVGVTVDEVSKEVEKKASKSDVSEIELEYGKMIQDMLSNQNQADKAQGRAIVDHSDLSLDMDDGVRKKRKRGPGTREKKAEKKKKERIRRAEKNRQLGVKRLKIQPMVKQRTIQICRHYLQGRCQQGDECKFSHDATPFTKSQPCSHFARNSCMKGDDCPYDHQLSKYPCNQFVSNGFCPRGTNCSFSHEAQHREGTPGSVNASSTELKDSSISSVTNPEKKMTSNQKVDAKSSFSVKSSSKIAEQRVAEINLRSATPAPKGISKLLFGKSSLGTENKAKFNLSMINSTQNMVSNLLGTSKVAGRNEQKGSSSFSFGKPQSHDIHTNKEKLPISFSKQAESLKLTNQIGESKIDSVLNLSEAPKKTPSAPPKGINFLAFGKSPTNNSCNMVTATSDNGASSSAQESQLCKGTPSSSLKSLLSNGPSSAQKALQSTLAFAAKFESRIKIS